MATTGYTKNFVVKNGITTGSITLDANSGNITGTNLSVTGLSNLGNIGNVKITGGNSGQAIVTDGTGNLSFANASSTSSPAPMPTYIAVGDDVIISANYQGLFGYPITIDGELTVDGVLIDVNDNGSGGNGVPGGLNTQLQYNNASAFGGIPTATYEFGILSLGSNSQIKITGGSTGQYLQTDGAGNLSWAAGGGGGNGSPGGITTQVQFNDAGEFAGNTGFTFNKTFGIFTAPVLFGGGNGLSNIQGANITGAVAYATTANSVAVANVSGIGNIATINKDGNASTVLYGNGIFTTAYGNSNVATFLANYGSNTITTTGNVSVGNIIGNGQSLTGIAGANVTGTVANATYAVTAGTANSVAGANVSGQVGNSLIASTVYTNAQPNITSVGTLTSVTVSGNANLGNAVTANYFTGNFYGTANLATYATTANSVAGANVSGQVGNALIAGTVYTNAQPNITSVGTLTNVTVSGTSNLGDVGNITITGGTSGQMLSTNGSGTLTWATPSTITTSIVSGTTQTAVQNYRYVLANASASTLTLPSSPTLGDTVYLVVANDLLTNIVARNGQKIMSLDQDMTINSSNAAFGLLYTNSTLGWRVI